MPIDLDRVFATSNGELYFIKSDHRNSSPEKSQWIIERDDEIAIFEYTCIAKWLSTTQRNAWGLHFQEDKPQILGSSAAIEPLKQNLWIAKFMRSLEPLCWHGYPANYRIKQQDRPEIGILQDWYSKGHIKKQDIARIRCGKKSNLSD